MKYLICYYYKETIHSEVVDSVNAFSVYQKFCKWVDTNTREKVKSSATIADFQDGSSQIFSSYNK
jgi:hypothetical protein